MGAAPDEGGMSDTSSASREVAVIEQTMRESPAEYRRDVDMQARYIGAIARRDGVPTGVPDSWRASPAMARTQLDPAIVAAWSAGGAFAVNLRRFQDTAAAVVSGLGNEVSARSFLDAFERLPSGVQTAIYLDAGRGVPSYSTPATVEDIELFKTAPFGAALLGAWRGKSSHRLGIVIERFKRVEAAMTSGELASFRRWWAARSLKEKVAVLWAAGGSSYG